MRPVSAEAADVLELGGVGFAGVTGVAVLRDGAVVATLRMSPWRKSATAHVAGREWVYTSRRRELTGRLAAEPEGTARLRARCTSFWRSRWAVDLDGAVLEVQGVTRPGANRFVYGGQVVAETGSTGGRPTRRTLSAVEGVPLDHQVFLLWVGMVLDRRYRSDSGAGGDGGSGDGGSGDGGGGDGGGGGD